MIAFPYMGGKYLLSKHIISKLRNLRTYVEPFFGSGSVLLHKNASPVEIANDLNDNVYIFFKVLRENPDELIRRLKATPYHRTEFKVAWDRMQSDPDEIERARAFYVRARMSVSGTGIFTHYNRFGTHYCETRNGKSLVTSRFLSHIDSLKLISERLKSVVFENMDALSVIEKANDEDTMIYCDPPYIHSSRSSKHLYGDFEMSNEEHIKLADALNSSKASVAISHYDCDLMNELYPSPKWAKHKIKSSTQSMGGILKEEFLWLNYAVDDTLFTI